MIGVSIPQSMASWISCQALQDGRAALARRCSLAPTLLVSKDELSWLTRLANEATHLAISRQPLPYTAYATDALRAELLSAHIDSEGATR